MFWKKKNTPQKKLVEPRIIHYIFAHQAIRQICRQEPHHFFGVLASDEQQAYVQFMIDQVTKLNSEEAADFSAADIQVTITRIGHYPMVVFTMPEAIAYTECIYIAIVSMIDGNKPEDYPFPEIKCFTLELGEGENGEDICFFCQWQDDDHLHIGEMDNKSNIGDFALAIKQQIFPN